MTQSKAFDDYLLALVLFVFTGIGFSILTFLSWLTAFAHDEGTVNEVIGTIGYYSFHVFRFPFHNLFWGNRAFVTDHYFLLLFLNVLFYSLLTTISITIWRKRRRDSI